MNFKNFICIALMFAGSVVAQTKDPVVMTVAGNNITKSEFEYIYNKNNSTVSLSEPVEGKPVESDFNRLSLQSLREYADLYADLKRKVAEAKAQGLDTLPEFKNEFKTYRTQSAKPYLTDTKTEEKLVREAYNRLKEEVQASHILVRTKTGTPEDTLTAYKKAMEIRKRLNKEDFATVAKEVSEDTGTAQKGGEVGYITGFQTVLPFEETAYATPVGKISQPVRSQFGYHIIKVTDRRPSQGSIHVAHIMKIFPQQASQHAKDSLKAALQSVYDNLQSGADFALLAKQNSEHIYTSGKGGELGWFSTGGSGAGENFEKAAFALKVGEFSKPVESLYGYHIIKLLDKKNLEPFEDKKADIAKRLKSDVRSLKAQQEFKKSLRKEYGLQITQTALAQFPKTEKLDSVFFVKTEKLNKPLFTFQKNQFTQNQFTEYLKKYKNQPANLNERLYAFADDKLYEYEESRLEEKYPEFKLLMQEYYDGILMFNVSSKEIWEKASEDTDGLEKYFEANKAKYAWETPHYKGIIVYCKDKKTEKKARKIIENSPADSVPVFLARALNTDKNIAVKVMKGLFAKGENKAVDKIVFNTGDYQPEKEYPTVFAAKGGKTLTVPENYREVKGTVLSDYQNELQEKWLEKLRAKYPAKIDEAVLQTVEIK